MVTLHDGSKVQLRKMASDYDPNDRQRAAEQLEEYRRRGEIPTGILYIDKRAADMHDVNVTTDVPLSQVSYDKLCPGSAALDEIQESFR